MTKLLISLVLLSITLGWSTILSPAARAEDKVAEDKVIECWFPPAWKERREQADKICRALSKDSAVSNTAQIANSYPEILSRFESGEQLVVYAGSFVSAIIKARDLGKALVQAINGKELYSGVMVYPRGKNPKQLLRDNPEEITYTFAASSGESSAKAATLGKARFPVASHAGAVRNVVKGRVKAAFVKNWWWEENKHRFPMLTMYRVPGVSEQQHADNVLAVSNAVGEPLVEKIVQAALVSKEAFGAQDVVEFDSAQLDFSISLMRKGGFNPEASSP